MAIAEHEVSTLDEYQIATLPQIKHRGYCYFPFHQNPQIAAQSGSIFWASKNPEDYICIVNDEMGGIISFTAPYFNPNAPLTLPIVSPYNQINLLTNTCYIIQPLIHADSFAGSFDTVPTNTLQLTKEDSHIERIMLNLFKSYGHEEFDSDIAYYFTNDLQELILEHGKPAITFIGNIINRETLNHNLINEILKALGRIEDTDTKNTRFELLTSYLTNVSSTIRDGVVSGLSFLDDNRALPQLRILYERETAPILKGNIKVAIENLEL